MEIDAKDILQKIKDEDIDSKLFLGLEEGQLDSLLGIKSHGNKKAVMKKIAEIKKKFEDEQDVDEEEEDEVLKATEDVMQPLLKKNTSRLAY